MERQRTPILCAVGAGLLFTALITDGFIFVRRPETGAVLFVGELLVVRLVCMGLTAAGLAACRARTRTQTGRIYLLGLAVAVVLSAVQLSMLTVDGQSIDLSQFTPGFVLMLLGTAVICRRTALHAALDCAALGLSVLVWLSPEWLFGWGVSACFFDVLCITTTLFLLPAADAAYRAITRSTRSTRREL